MQRLFFLPLVLSLATVGCVVPSDDPLVITSEAQNPWTHLHVQDAATQFHFAVISDRAGLPRPGVLEQAVERLNLLQPAFVMSVGDLVEGYNEQGRITDLDRIAEDWSYVTDLMTHLEMPFFYVVGNNDINSPAALPLWQQRLGRTYYSFRYKDVLFVVLNSEDPPGPGGIGATQLAWLRTTMETHENARWTFLFLHRPLWTDRRDEWEAVEAVLAERPRTVFAGHRHQYAVDEVNGYRYYTLATTGGGSDLTGVADGLFDHVTWVTMTAQGPRLATLMLEGVWGDNPIAEARQAKPIPVSH